MTTSQTQSANVPLPAFERSAEVYDLFYAGKDYDREAALYLHHFGPARSVLEMGAGTGEFTRRWRDAGLEVLPVEPNPQMSRIFLRKHGDQPLEKTWMELGSAYMRAPDKKVEAFAAPFTVLGYAARTCTDAWHCLDGAYSFLRGGGRLVMDVLNYSACCSDVCTRGPRWCVGRSLDSSAWHRHMEKSFDVHSSILTIEATYTMEDEEKHHLDGFTERHELRAFTPTEIEFVCRQVGFRSVQCFPYDDESTSTRVGLTDFYFMVVAEK